MGKTYCPSTVPTHLEQADGAQVPQHLVVLQAVMERAPMATIARRMMFFILRWYSG
jgi:hypothetical protein